MRRSRPETCPAMFSCPCEQRSGAHGPRGPMTRGHFRAEPAKPLSRAIAFPRRRPRGSPPAAPLLCVAFSMTRRDWDRVRRNKPLEGADPRVDPDGAVLWQRDGRAEGDITARSSFDRFGPSGVRRLRAGIVVRRARERRAEEVSTPGATSASPEAGPHPSTTPTSSRPRATSPFDPNAWIECPRCKVRVPRRKLLLHARAACTRRG